MTIVSHFEDEPQLLMLRHIGIPPRAEVELRGRFGPHIAFDMRVMPVNVVDYLGLGQTSRLILICAFLYPPSELGDDTQGPWWGGGIPIREDLGGVNH